MILHKYIEAKFGIDFLMNLDMKVSLPSDFNDPFEMLPSDCGIWTLPKVKKYFKDSARIERMYRYQKSLGNFKSKKEFKKVIANKDELA